MSLTRRRTSPGRASWWPRARWKIREVRESRRFEAQCEELGGVRRIDEALDAVRWVLAVNADVYPVLPGRRSLRLAVTDPFTTPAGRVPRLRMYFRIVDDDLVELVWIEEAT